MKNRSQQVYHNYQIREVEKEDKNQLPLSGAALSLMVANNALTNPLIILTPDHLTTFKTEQELRFFLGEKGKGIPILTFPNWETLPYDHFSPHNDVISQRVLTLYELINLKKGIVFIDVATLMHQLPPLNYIMSNSFVLKTKESIEPYQLRQKLETYGYNCVNNVMEHGEIAIRGSIIDIFPMGSKLPFRIDFLDDEVDSIRTFDIDTQLSIKIIDNIQILPAKEFPLDEQGTNKFAESWWTYFDSNPRKYNIYQAIASGKSYPGIEYYLPLFFEKTATFFDFVPTESNILILNNCEQSMRNFWDEVNNRYEQLAHDISRPILKPETMFISPQKIFELIGKFPKFLNNSKDSLFNFRIKKDSFIFKENTAHQIFNNVKTLLLSQQNIRILFTAESPGRLKPLLEILKSNELIPNQVTSWQQFIKSLNKIAIITTPIERPLDIILEKDGDEILVITEAQIHGTTISQERRTKTIAAKTSTLISELIEMQIGAPVVHIDYGIGRYLGIEKITNNGIEAEFLVLEYANHTKLFVPVTSFELISRYTGIDADHVLLSHLGSKQWEKTKHKAQEQIRDTAAELLELYAKRHASKGFKFTKPESDYTRFAADFPFIVTTDQKQAIDDVVSDMTTGQPMDRLICGDVGFGKTEVAMHATFLAAYNNKQVAILTPTTLLAQQHFNNFQDRFSSWPIKIAIFSRFNNTKEQKKVIEDLATGKLDVVIGTHKLLQKNVKFKSLGLLIIDEEHRFGVRQKEQIKKLANNIDILSLTATPIPRTLNMAFAGAKDFSIIATPPLKRLAIKTFIHEYKSYLIKEAISREILRGGQVYYLHNNIASIEKTARELQKLMPTIKIAVAHGQMGKQQLGKIMRDFYHLEINVLVCTTIIESGLDIPTANTIIIDRADLFGLAQLHQIRGRVGRSHHQAYAYLIIPPKSLLTPDAKKRLDAITAMKELGTGFVLATHDLEIRGAGELLGEKQSGVMQSIGFTLYMEMLEEAVKTLKYNKDLEPQEISETKTEVELQISALIPEGYIRDVNTRLIFYKRIAAAKNQEELDRLQIEMIDRFALLPTQTQNLFKIAELKLKAQKSGIKKITLSSLTAAIEFSPKYSFEHLAAIKIIEKYGILQKFLTSYTVSFLIKDEESKLEIIDNLLTDFNQNLKLHSKRKF